jgi:uncharacterized protein (DUF934 family)
MTLRILSAAEHTDIAQAFTVANDVDAHTLAFDNVQRIDLNFPKFTDGRAFSQAFVLRRRGFTGDIRAHGDVLIDQLLQMQRSGFSSAVLRADQDAAHGQQLLGHYKGFYQGDAVHADPHFKHAA